MRKKYEPTPNIGGYEELQIAEVSEEDEERYYEIADLTDNNNFEKLAKLGEQNSIVQHLIEDDCAIEIRFNEYSYPSESTVRRILLMAIAAHHNSAVQEVADFIEGDKQYINALKDGLKLATLMGNGNKSLEILRSASQPNNDERDQGLSEKPEP